MLQYSEFLKETFISEASISDVKAAAISAVEAGKYSYTNTEDSRLQFSRDMRAEGFRGSEVSNAWKSLAVTGEIFKKGGSKPVVKPVSKAPDTKSILSKYQSILKDLHYIQTEGKKITASVKSQSQGGDYNNWVAAQDAAYIDDIVKIINTRISVIKSIK